MELVGYSHVWSVRRGGPRNRGTVFSVSSTIQIGRLAANGCDSDVFRLTENVLTAFTDPAWRQGG